ncbi:hypothetical protein Acr_27g0000190 [Actinidia rufa]|uniref:Uncharacterized protein n=1 Tax=Actinidia rufa TaxID=165716 RepID=A0A7J0H5B2_9ERIC|nr:hypothetical protein Acr_27g0000190 [Actinidia rufa]
MRIFQNSICNGRMVEDVVVSLIAFYEGLVCVVCVVVGECYTVCWRVGALFSEPCTM